MTETSIVKYTREEVGKADDDELRMTRESLEKKRYAVNWLRRMLQVIDPDSDDEIEWWAEHLRWMLEETEHNLVAILAEELRRKLTREALKS
jgi:hypothetical protein